MTKSFSVYLDIVRFLAAILVLLYHSNIRLLTTEGAPFSQFGHSAVIVFFILSGYVIAYITDIKEHKIQDYSVSRLARIYSVALPVVLITPIVDFLGQEFGGAFYEGREALDYFFIRLVSSLLFLNEIWFVSIMSFSNVPYWSLCYEVWYYALFASYIFMQGKKRIIVISTLCICLGPKILLLFPIWLIGVYLYKNQKLRKLSAATGLVLWILSLVCIYLFHKHNIQWLFANMLIDAIGQKWYDLLTFSKYFLSDYILAPLISINFIGARAFITKIESPLLFFKPVIAYASGFTFILYLIHEPFLRFFSTLINGNPDNMYFYWQVIGLTVFAVWCLGQITENKKTLWKQFFKTFLDKVASLMIKKSRREPL